MKSSYLKLSVGLCIFMLLTETTFAQQKNPTTHPYGGSYNRRGRVHFNSPVNFSSAEFDSLAYFTEAWFPRLADFDGAKFHSQAHFTKATFDSLADFREAKFDSLANFVWTKFRGLAHFTSAQFKSRANFFLVRFKSRANFKKTRFDSLADFQKAQFKSLANFEEAKFDNLAHFEEVKFDSLAHFQKAKFDSLANFEEAKFNGPANFNGAEFHSLANFEEVKFDSLAHFQKAKFDSLANFEEAKFNGPANFNGAEFHSLANFGLAGLKILFGKAQFKSLANFKAAQFDSLANFPFVQFHSLADFTGAKFNGPVNFTRAKFRGTADFKNARFHGQADFTAAKFDSMVDFTGTKLRDKVRFTSATFNPGIGLDFRRTELDSTVDFSLATLKDTLLIGTPKSGTAQKFDFMRAYLLPAGQDIFTINDAGEILSQWEVQRRMSQGDTTLAALSTKTVRYPGAKIILFGPVELNMQAEKIEFLALGDSLDYYAKKDIITHLKEDSFAGEKFSNARFELDYLFAKSTIYQKQSVHFEEYSWYQPVVWAQWLYKATMELGYRPFRLLYWVAAINFLFAIFYLFRPKMRQQVNQYINGGKPAAKNKQAGFSDSFINILYFSFMLFFTFRLKQNVLTSFETKEKRVVVFHWLIGFAVYVSFLTFSKAGSVLHTLKSLFVG